MTKGFYLLLTFITFTTSLSGQIYNEVKPASTSISENLDLKAVASVFGASKNLADFENQLNDPKLKLSNLDLNYDNEVDYLRVIETIENNAHFVVIQAVIGEDQFQDVATIAIEKTAKEKIIVQVVGDSYLFGSTIIYEPNYFHTPAIYSIFWNYNYNPYRSKWRWRYYPKYFVHWRPFPTFKYQKQIRSHINFRHQYPIVKTHYNMVLYTNYKNRRANSYEKKVNKASSQLNTTTSEIQTNRFSSRFPEKQKSSMQKYGSEKKQKQKKEFKQTNEHDRTIRR